jgi:hypothetical protein
LEKVVFLPHNPNNIGRIIFFVKISATLFMFAVLALRSGSAP